MKYKRYYATRQWLNPVGHHDSGAIEAKVEEDYGSRVAAELSIWDCGRKITLAFDFDAKNKESAAQRADKIALLIKVLTEMQEAMGVAFDERKDIEYNYESDYE